MLIKLNGSCFDATATSSDPGRKCLFNSDDLNKTENPAKDALDQSENYAYRKIVQNKMQHGPRRNMDQDATKIKMQHKSRCNKEQDEIWIKMQQGSSCNKNQDVRWIKMQHGSRCNVDQYAT